MDSSFRQALACRRCRLADAGGLGGDDVDPLAAAKADLVGGEIRLGGPGDLDAATLAEIAASMLNQISSAGR